MKLMAVLALACGFTAAPMMAAGTASGFPMTCDGADCVPYVDRDVVEGAPCHFQTRYPFGLDSKGGTLVCTAKNEWALSVPLIGVRTLRAPCDPKQEGAAQSADGIPLTCDGLAWTADYTAIHYPA